MRNVKSDKGDEGHRQVNPAARPIDKACRSRNCSSEGASRVHALAGRQACRNNIFHDQATLPRFDGKSAPEFKRPGHTFKKNGWETKLPPHLVTDDNATHRR